MKRITAVVLLSLALTGCYKSAPSEQEAIDTAKKEVLMAVCGDKTNSCVDVSGGKAHIADRRNDNTNQVTVTFKTIKANGDAQESRAVNVDAGMVVYDFDAKTGEAYIKQLSLWSDDGKHSIELCGHDYKFCRK
ncbi:hypothetical protein ACHEUO_22435 [Klebsiella oxytoca]|uniref:hypothetical protein n=1 Tax=Klebsiella oxytoca TaxID=571 RepID=UPI0018C497C2|nr:hypothetical protein [Klebsiella oxytoca]MBG2649394.1 hypothetical protein [Klebsiella oxytoca]HCQ6671024.1 hypothetical protein [Klebsiella oxytoca]